VRLDAVDPFADHLVVYERRDGETRVRVLDLAKIMAHVCPARTVRAWLPL